MQLFSAAKNVYFPALFPKEYTFSSFVFEQDPRMEIPLVHDDRIEYEVGHCNCPITQKLNTKIPYLEDNFDMRSQNLPV